MEYKTPSYQNDMAISSVWAVNESPQYTVNGVPSGCWSRAERKLCPVLKVSNETGQRDKTCLNNCMSA